MGDGGRARRDEPAVGSSRRSDPARVGRVAGRAPGQALVRRCRGGTPARAERSSPRRSRCIGLPIVQQPHDRRRSRRSGIWHVRCSSGTRSWPATGRPVTSSSSATTGSSSGSGCSRPVCVGSICSTTRRCSSSTTSVSAPTSPRHVTSTGGGSDARTARSRAARSHARRCSLNRRGIELDDYPDTWWQGDAEYRISYRFEPDTPLDGATLDVPLTAAQPARRHRVRLADPGLPARARGAPGPVAAQGRPSRPDPDERDDRRSDRAARVRPEGRLVDALARALTEVVGSSRSTRSDFDLDRLPNHLRLHIVVVDEDGAVVDAGDDLVGDSRSTSRRRHDRPWPTRRPVDGAPRHRALGHRPARPGRRAAAGQDGHVVRAYPTLLDRGDSVALRVVDNEALQQRAMRGGVRRLLLMAAAPTPAKIERTLDQRASSRSPPARSRSPTSSPTASRPPSTPSWRGTSCPWDDAAFGRLERAVRDETPQLAADALAVAADVMAAATRVRKRTAALTAEALRPTVGDAEAHLARLVSPGFRSAFGYRSPARRLHRYVRGIEYRLDHLAGDVRPRPAPDGRRAPARARVRGGRRGRPRAGRRRGPARSPGCSRSTA